jgi:hypothetical protein
VEDPVSSGTVRQLAIPRVCVRGVQNSGSEGLMQHVLIDWKRYFRENRMA